MGSPTVALASMLLATIGTLLVAFLLLAVSGKVDRIRMGLPTSRVRVDAPPGAACVVVAREGSPSGWGNLVYRFSDGKEATRPLGGPTDIFLAALRVVSEEPERPFAIKADAGVRYAAIDDVLEQLRKAGVHDLTLLTRPSAPGGNP